MGLRNDTRIVQTTTLDNSFSWQVGYHDYASTNDLPQFRATIRPLTNDEQYNRVPNGTILYEETGIRINSADNLGSWSFPLTTNAALAGGPYREYQVVIEAHDSQGNTSAGNRVGTSNESNWSLYPYGYDILAVSNPRTTGIEMSDNLITTEYFTTGIWPYFTLISGANFTSSTLGLFTGRVTSANSGFIGTGAFYGSGQFVGTYNFTSFSFTQDGLSTNRIFTGIGFFSGSGSFYSGIKFLGTDVLISGTTLFTGNYYLNDTGIKTLPRTGEYGSRGFINGEGGIRIQFTDGDFPDDLRGGYIYAYTGRFPKKEAAINAGQWGQVQKTKFEFDPKFKYINHPSAASNFRGAPYLYVSVSFYDEMDELTIINNPDIDISTGLYMSNNTILYNDTAPGTVSVGGVGTILTMKINSVLDTTWSNIQTTASPYLPAGYQAIGITTDGISSIIYYISTPITNSPYGGTPGGNVVTSGAAGGGGGGSVSTPGTLGSVSYSQADGYEFSTPSFNLGLTVGGSATRIHYKTTATTVDSAPTSYSTKIGTSVTVTLTSSKRVWARASDGTNHSSWQYQNYYYVP